MALWRVLIYKQGRWRNIKTEIHFLAEMSIGTATLASRIALASLANSIRGKATSRVKSTNSTPKRKDAKCFKAVVISYH